MLKSWKFWIVNSLIVSLIGIFAFGLTKDPKKVPSPLVGKPAPDFEVVSLKGKRLQLSELRGKAVVLNFWASWCLACREEAHILESFHQQYGVQKNRVQFIGIAIQDTLENANRFAKQFNKTYFLALDDEAGKISLDYGLYGVPETFFIDLNGVIRLKHVGAVSVELMERQIPNLFKDLVPDSIFNS